MVIDHFVLLGPLLVTLTNHAVPPFIKIYVLGAEKVTVVTFPLIFQILVIELRVYWSL